MPINIIHQFQLSIPATTTLTELKELVRHRLGIPPARQSLFHDGDQLVGGDQTLQALNVPIDSTLILTIRDRTPASSSGGDRFGGHNQNLVQHNAISANAYGFNNSNQMYPYYGPGPYYNPYHAAANSDQWNQPILNYWGAPSATQVDETDAHHRNEVAMIDQPSANQRDSSAAHENAAGVGLIELIIMRANSNKMLTNFAMEVDSTMYQVKQEIEKLLGYPIQSQLLNDGETTLNDQSSVQEIPNLLESGVVYLTIVSE